MAIASILDKIADGPRAYDKWRLSSKATIGGIVMVLGVQLVVGLILAMAIRLLFGLPNNAVVNLLTFGFAVGSALSGPIVMLIWSVLFFNLAGIMLGMFFGVWINLPSWWHAAADQWASGTSIPGVIFLSLVGAFVLWVAASKGFSIGWGILTMKLFNALRNRAKGEQVSRVEAVRSSAEKSVLPSEAEARRAIAAVDSAGEDGIILRAPSLTGRTPEPEAPPAPLTSDDRSSIYESLGGSSNDPLLEGLHKDIDPSETISLSKDEADPVPAAPAVAVAPAAVAPPPKQSPSKDREQRRRRLETMVEIFIDRIHTEGAEQNVMQDYVRKNSAELKSFSAMDFEILSEIDGGENLIEASKNARGGMPVAEAVIEERIDNFAAAQMGAGNFVFDNDTDEAAPAEAPAPEPEKPSGGQEIAMGKRLASLLRRATEGDDVPDEPVAADPAPVVEPVVEVASEPEVGTSNSLMAEMFPGMVIVDSTTDVPDMRAAATPVVSAADLKEDEISGELLIPEEAPFGGRFGENVAASEDDHEIKTEDGMSFSIASEATSDIVTGSGTMVPQDTSLAGSLPLSDDSKDDEMQDDFANVPVPPIQAKEIYEILTTVHVASDQIDALRLSDAKYSYPTNRAILSSEFTERLGDQAAAQARNRFQHIREAYLADPVQSMRNELDSVLSRLKTIASRPITVGDPRVFVIHGEVNELAEKINASPTTFGDLLVEAQQMIDLLEQCLVHYRGDGAPSAPKPPVATAPPPPPPLSRQDFNETGDALSAMAPAGMADRLGGHDDPKAAHLAERFSGASRVGPTAEELGGAEPDAPAPVAPQAPPAPPADAPVDTAASPSSVDGDVIDNEDYGLSDEDIDRVYEPFKSDYAEGTMAWKMARNSYDQMIDIQERARLQRDARRAREARDILSFDDAAGPGPEEQARFHLEMEERLAEVVRREEAARAEQARLDEEREAIRREGDEVRKQRDEVISDATDIDNQRRALEEVRADVDARSSEPTMDFASKMLVEAGKGFFKIIPELPEELCTPDILRMSAEFDAVKITHLKMVNWSDDTRGDRKQSLENAGLDEKSIHRLEPCSVSLHVLKVYTSYLAKNLVVLFREHLNLSPDLSPTEVVAKIHERFGDDRAIRRLTGNMEDYDDSRCMNLFAATMEEQAKLAEYMQMPLSELRSITKTISELTARAETAEADRASMEESMKSYRTKSERLQLELEASERSGENRGGSKSFSQERSIDDTAESLGVSRENYVVHGKVQVEALLEAVSGAEVVPDASCVVIADKLFFSDVQLSADGISVITTAGAESVEGLATSIRFRYPAVKSWFVVTSLSKLQAIVKDKEVLSSVQVIDLDFDAIIKAIVS